MTVYFHRGSSVTAHPKSSQCHILFYLLLQHILYVTGLSLVINIKYHKETKSWNITKDLILLSGNAGNGRVKYGTVQRKY
jgi:hypothetical protein